MNGFRFHTVASIIVEAGVACRLGPVMRAQGARRVLLVSDPGLRALGLYAGALASLTDTGLAVTLFCEVEADPSLVKAVARAHKWFDDLASGRACTLGDIARAEGCHKRYVGRLLPLAFLAPDIVEAILAGTPPVDFTAETLTRQADLPLSWTAQKVLLGFD